MEALLATILPALKDLVTLPSTPAAPPVSTPESRVDTSSATKPAAPQSNAIVAPPALIPATPSVVASPLAHDPSLRLPFQFALGTVSSRDDKGLEFVFASLPQLAKLVSPYRRARLVSLEAVLEPVLPLGNGYSIIVAWTQANTSVVGADALAVPGAQLFSVTSYAVLAQSQVLPAPLRALNPVVKDSVTYTDSPKLHLSPIQVEGAGSALLVLRGLLEVSSPALIATTS